MRSDREYREVVTRGERIRTEHFAIYRDRPGGPRKAGISVGRQVGEAVERNRLKRVLRELYRLHKEYFPPGSRTVLVARRAPGEVTLAAARREILPAIARRWGRQE